MAAETGAAVAGRTAEELTNGTGAAAMSETILVTGATGKVGERLVPRLLAWRSAGDEVRVLVRTADAAARFEALGARAVVGDVTDAADRKQALDGVTVVVNSAAAFRGLAQSPETMYVVNRDAAVALAREAAEAGVRRFVQISTNLAYGPGIGRPLREDDELRAVAGEAYSAYPHSKAEAEEQLRALSAEAGLDVVTLRLAFVYGEGDPHIEEVLPRFAGQAAHSLLAMVHHADVAQAVRGAINTLGQADGPVRAGLADQPEQGGQAGRADHPGQAGGVAHPGQAARVDQPGQADRADHPGQAARVDQPGQAGRADHPGQAARVDQPGQAGRADHPGQAGGVAQPGQAGRADQPRHGAYRAYNVAGDGASTMVELFDLVGRSFDVEAAAGREAADPWFGIPDTTRAYRELGFRPIYPTARAAWRDGAL
jgi:nucleoside-diphosphate-sugar epimerase